MAIEVEDGTAKNNAESYCTVAFADMYFSLRGVTAWVGTELVKESALRKATDYLEQAYRNAWTGYRLSATQRLSWPRINATRDGFDFSAAAVPIEVQTATAELAVRSLTAPLLTDIDDTAMPISEASLGTLSVSYDTTPRSGKRQKTYAAVDSMLAVLMENGKPNSSFGMVDVVRA